jgi:hypothetical protein
MLNALIASKHFKSSVSMAVPGSRWRRDSRTTVPATLGCLPDGRVLPARAPFALRAALNPPRLRILPSPCCNRLHGYAHYSRTLAVFVCSADAWSGAWSVGRAACGPGRSGGPNRRASGGATGCRVGVRCRWRATGMSRKRPGSARGWAGGNYQAGLVPARARAACAKANCGVGRELAAALRKRRRFPSVKLINS